VGSNSSPKTGFLDFLCDLSQSLKGNRTRNSSVGIATDYWLDDLGGRSSNPGRVKKFLFSTSSRPALGSTQPPIQRIQGTLKRPGRKADHSPTASV
jgi:hypothetical protein